MSYDFGRAEQRCAKLELANSKNNKILTINVLQKFTSLRYVLPVKLFVTDKVFLVISLLEEWIVAKI